MHRLSFSLTEINILYLQILSKYSVHDHKHNAGNELCWVLGLCQLYYYAQIALIQITP